jgi:heat shock protein HslJ
MRNAISCTLLAALLFVACAPVAAAVGLDGTNWTLVGTSNVTLSFADGHATGNGGCNQYRASYTASGSTLTLGPAMATKRACLESDKNAQETAYFDALGRVTTYEISGDRLTLRDAANTAVLEFTRR